jgi:hypothetical protein
MSSKDELIAKTTGLIFGSEDLIIRTDIHESMDETIYRIDYTVAEPGRLVIYSTDITDPKKPKDKTVVTTGGLDLDVKDWEDECSRYIYNGNANNLADIFRDGDYLETELEVLARAKQLVTPIWVLTIGNSEKKTNLEGVYKSRHQAIAAGQKILKKTDKTSHLAVFLAFLGPIKSLSVTDLGMYGSIYSQTKPLQYFAMSLGP